MAAYEIITEDRPEPNPQATTGDARERTKLVVEWQSPHL